MGYFNERKSQNDSAFFYYRSGISLAKRFHLPERLLELYSNTGALFEQVDVYDSALHYFTLADSLTKKNYGPPETQAIVASNLGLVHFYLKDYSTALSAYKKAFSIAEQNNIVNYIPNCYINLARTYNELDSLNKASRQIELLEKTFSNRLDSTILANAYYQKGYNFIKRKMPNEAADFFQKAYTISHKIGNRLLASNSLYRLASLNFEKGLDNTAIENLLAAKEMAEGLQHRRLLTDIYLMLSDLYGKNGNTNLALHYHKLYATLGKNIFNEEVAKNIRNIQLDEQKNESLLLLTLKDLELGKLSSLTVVLTIGFIIALTFVFLIIRDIRIDKHIKASMAKNMAEMISEREMQLRKIFRSNLQSEELTNRVNGFLKGPVATLAGLANIMKSVTTIDEYKECAAKLDWHCRKIDIVLKDMEELILVKNHILFPENIAFTLLAHEIYDEFRKINTFLLLNIDIQKNVKINLNTDRRLLLSLVTNAINYFGYINDNPIIEVSVSQKQYGEITVIAVKHYSIDNCLIPDENQIHHFSALVIAGQLKGWAKLLHHDNYRVFELSIPTDITLEINTILDVKKNQ